MAKRISPDMARAVAVEIPADLAAKYRGWKQPKGECTNCGQKHADLRPMTVAAYGAVVDGKICPECREALADTRDAIGL